MNKKIQILDATLREGEQSRGVCFSIDEKILIANKLRDFGVDIIEIGHPAISDAEALYCKRICDEVKDIDILVHARACDDDILAAKQTGAKWVGIWASYNDIALETKFFGKSRAWILQQVANAVYLANQLGFMIRFTVEDASRTPLSLCDELIEVAMNNGANRISLADTTGCWHPSLCAEAVKHVINKFNCEVEVHLHNDLNLAHANAIAAIEAGATVVDATMLGIGERAGICDTVSLAATLMNFYNQSYNFKLSHDLAKDISIATCINIESHHPVIGRNAFTHVAKYHAKAVLKNPKSYEAIDPQIFGTSSKIMQSKYDRPLDSRINYNLDIKKPFIKGSSELLYHRDGVGLRWVLMDNRVDPRSRVYIIERIFDKDYSNISVPHVDSHAHNCDSVFIFMGDNEDGSGLIVNVTFGVGDNVVVKQVISPASVYIPANIYHSYEYISGTGRFLNFVLSPNYNDSII